VVSLNELAYSEVTVNQSIIKPRKWILQEGVRDHRSALAY